MHILWRALPVIYLTISIRLFIAVCYNETLENKMVYMGRNFQINIYTAVKIIIL